jgi:hypothetical protein
MFSAAPNADKLGPAVIKVKWQASQETASAFSFAN